jgi:hypothetical protein
MPAADDFDPTLSPAARAELQHVAALLAGDRPAPQPAFRGELGRAVDAQVRSRHLRRRPEHLGAIVAMMLVAGVLLLLFAASQV